MSPEPHPATIVTGAWILAISVVLAVAII